MECLLLAFHPFLFVLLYGVFMRDLTSEALKWMFQFESNLEELRKKDQQTFEAYENAIKQISESIQNDIAGGIDSLTAYNTAFSKIGETFEKTFPGMKIGIEAFQKSLDPEIFAKYRENIFSLFTVREDFAKEPFIRKIIDESLLRKEFRDLKAIAAKQGAELGDAIKYSSIPYMRGIGEALSLVPDSDELAKSIKTVIESITEDSRIPREFFARLTDPTVLQWWMKQWAHRIRTSKPQELQKNLSLVYLEGMRKGFFPKMEREWKMQGKKIESAFSGVFKFFRAQTDVLSVAVGTALSKTVSIITDSVTSVFDPFLEALSYLVEVSLWPIQEALYQLFYTVQPYILEFTQVLGRVVYSLLPVFKTLLKLLQPLFIILAKSVTLLEVALRPVCYLFSVISNIISGEFIPSGGVLGAVLSKIGTRLSNLKVIFDVLGWVLGFILVPLFIKFSYLLVAYVVKSTINVIIAQWELIKSLIVAGARWLMEHKIISKNTFALIENFSIRKLIARFSLVRLASSLREVWKWLVLEKIEWIKSTIAKLRNIVATKQQTIANKIHAASIEMTTKATKTATISTGRWTKALALTGAALGAILLWNSEWTDWTDILTNSLMFLASVVLPLLSLQFKGVSLATWLWKGALAAVNFVLKMGPIGWAVTAVVALVTAVGWLIKKIYESSPGLIPGLKLVGDLFVFVFDLGLSLIKVVISAVTSLVKIVYNAVSGAIRWISSTVSSVVFFVEGLIYKTVEWTISGIFNIVSSMLSLVYQAVSFVVSGIFGIIKSVIEGVISAVTGIGLAIKSIIKLASTIFFLTTPIGLVTTAFSALIKLFFRGESAALSLSGAVKLLWSLASSVVTIIQSLISTIFSGIGKVISFAWSLLSGILSSVIKVFKEIVNGISRAISVCLGSAVRMFEVFVSVLATAINWITAVGAAVTSMAGPFKFVGKLFTSIVKWFTEAWSRVFSLIGRVLKPLSSVVKVLDIVRSAWSKVFDIMSRAANRIFDVFSGIFKGITSVLSKAKEWLFKWVKLLPKAIRSWLGLSEPEEIAPVKIDQDEVRKGIAQAGKAIEQEMGRLDDVSQKVVGVQGPVVTEVETRAVESWRKQGETSGKAVSEAFSKGQVAGIQQVAKASEEVAQTASVFLPHSDAKEGPLSNLSETGESFIKTFMQGVFGKIDYMENAIRRVFEPIVSLIPSPVRALLTPTVNDVDIKFDLEAILKSGKFASPIVNAINDQTTRLIEFWEEALRLNKDLDISDLEAISRFHHA